MVPGMDLDIDIDGEGPYVSWGQAGMDLEMDDVPAGSSSRPRSFSRSMVDDLDMGSPNLTPQDYGNGRKVGGLLWSANYFFYSK